jgi:hypothetical protein
MGGAEKMNELAIESKNREKCPKYNSRKPENQESMMIDYKYKCK